jgi:hypothetical protein
MDRITGMEDCDVTPPVARAEPESSVPGAGPPGSNRQAEHRVRRFLVACAEIITGLALLVVPLLVGRLLLGEELTGIAIPVARVTGIALIALGIACWLTDGGNVQFDERWTTDNMDMVRAEATSLMASNPDAFNPDLAPLRRGSLFHAP